MDEVINCLGKSIFDATSICFLKKFKGKRVDSRLETLNAIEFPEDGISFTLNKDSIVITIYLFSEGLDGRCQFSEEIPAGICFGDSRSTVIDKLQRVPALSGGGDEWNGKIVPYWDRFQLDECLLRVQYSRIDNRVELITLMVSNIEDMINRL